MSITKTLSLFIFVSLASCSKNDIISLLSEQSFQLNSDEHILRIGIRANADWKVEGDTVWWCKMEPMRGQQQDSLLIHVDVNLIDNPREVIWKVSDGNETEEIHIRQAAATEEYLYKLPTVFHILSDSAEPTDEELEDRLLYLLKKANDFFAGENRRKIKVKLEFVPIKTTPQKGMLLKRPGIHWEQHDYYKDMAPRDFIDNIYGDAYRLWDPNKYINIYIMYCPPSNYGLTALPFTPENNALEGLLAYDRYYRELPDDFLPCVIINRRHIFKESMLYDFIHELGHYFGLHHVFYIKKPNNTGRLTDYCDDTPHYNRTDYNTWCANNPSGSWEEKIQRTANDGTTFISTNIEDYPDGYRDEITSDQYKRIRHVLHYSPMIPGPKIPVKLNLHNKSSKGLRPLAE